MFMILGGRVKQCGRVSLRPGLRQVIGDEAIGPGTKGISTHMPVSLPFLACSQRFARFLHFHCTPDASREWA